MTDGTRLMFVPNSKSQMSLAARRNICYLRFAMRSEPKASLRTAPSCFPICN